MMNGHIIVDGVGRGDDRLDGDPPKLIPRNELFDKLLDAMVEERFQAMCHDRKTEDVQRFCDGCEQYQIEKFGRSPITDLRARLAFIAARCAEWPHGKNLLADFRDASDLSKPFTATMEPEPKP